MRFTLALWFGCAACAASSTTIPPAATPAAVPAPAAAAAAATGPLSLTYLGVAGWAISDGTHTVVSDPYFTRPNFAANAPISSDEAAIAAHAPAKVDLILIGHAHIDHVLDAPALARRTGASIIGTVSTANYARTLGVPDQQIITVKGGEDYAFAGFSVRVLPGLHSALGQKHTFGADQIIAPGVRPTTMAQFAEGGTMQYLVRMAGHKIVVIGSANFIERELTGLRPDIAIVGTGLRQEIYDYSCRLMRALDYPATVIANHFDDWTEPPPAPGQPLPADDQQDLEAFAAEIHACSPATKVIVPKHFEPMRW
jgi:L-ascorbate metabolism protein UlaG (beta-lactamase superfamily)